MPSGDFDYTAYLKGDGTLVLCPSIKGAKKSKKYVKKAAPSMPRFRGKKVHAKEIFASTVLGKKGPRAFKFALVERALLLAIVGHDYDNRASPSGGPRGINGLGTASAVPAVVAASKEFKADGCPLDYLQKASAFIAGGKGSKDKTAADAKRIATVACGFVFHPYFNEDTGKAEAVTPLPTSKKKKKQAKEMIDPEQWSQLQAIAGKKYNCNKPYTHVGCMNCGVSVADLAERDRSQLDKVMKGFPPLQSMTAHAQPNLYKHDLDVYLNKASKTDKSKHEDEGTARAYDSAALVDFQFAESTNDKGEPIMIISSPISQSQARGPLTAAVVLRLSPDKGHVREIVNATCTCVRRDNKVMCRHRAGLLMVLWINTCMGIAGNPTARRGYWKGHVGTADGGAKAVPLIDCLTHRAKNPKIKELVEQEHTHTGYVATDDEESDSGGDDDVNDDVNEPKRIEKGRRTPTVVHAERKKRVHEHCGEHFKMDAKRLKKISVARGINCFTRKSDFS